MALKDEKKIVFIMDEVTYCYRVMPFSLKNVRATYQIMVKKVFKSLIGRNMEAYRDDIQVKSHSCAQH